MVATSLLNAALTYAAGPKCGSERAQCCAWIPTCAQTSTSPTILRPQKRPASTANRAVVPRRPVLPPGVKHICSIGFCFLPPSPA